MSSLRLPTAAAFLAVSALLSARHRSHAAFSRAASHASTAWLTSGPKANCAAASSSAASNSAAPSDSGTLTSASPWSLTNASAACVRTSPPSSTSASHSLRLASPGNTPTPSRVNHPATKSDGRDTPAARSFAPSAGKSRSTATSNARVSATSATCERVNSHGARRSRNVWRIQNDPSSSSVTKRSVAATAQSDATYPCGARAHVATNTRSSASSKQYSARGRALLTLEALLTLIAAHVPSDLALYPDDAASPASASASRLRASAAARTNLGWFGNTAGTSRRMRSRCTACRSSHTPRSRYSSYDTALESARSHAPELSAHTSARRRWCTPSRASRARASPPGRRLEGSDARNVSRAVSCLARSAGNVTRISSYLGGSRGVKEGRKEEEGSVIRFFLVFWKMGLFFLLKIEKKGGRKSPETSVWHFRAFHSPRADRRVRSSGWRGWVEADDGAGRVARAARTSGRATRGRGKPSESYSAPPAGIVEWARGVRRAGGGRGGRRDARRLRVRSRGGL